MSLSLELREPYPVYRAFRVPVWGRCGPVSVRRVEPGDVKALEWFIGAARRLAERLAAEARDDYEKLEVVANVAAVLLKAPLSRELSPVHPSPMKAQVALLALPDALFKRYFGLVKGDVYSMLRDVLGLDLGAMGLGEVFGREAYENVYRLWVAFPADTRPGYNTSSLAAHLLMTSALAWALAYESGKTEEERRREAAVARVAALLHDIGKAVDPERHAEESARIAEYLLKGIVGDEVLARVVGEVREHHAREGYVSRADRLASAADRLAKVVDRAIGDRVSRMEGLVGGRRDDWGFWRRLYERLDDLKREGLAREDPVKELTELFLERAEEAAENVRKEEKEEGVKGLTLLLFDVGSIQEFVYRSMELRVVAAASLLVDFVTYSYLPLYLRANGVRVPPEAFLYSGGGILLMLLPESLAERVWELARKVKEELPEPLRLVVADAEFHVDFKTAWEKIEEALLIAKLGVELADEPQFDPQNGRELCRLCLREWASTSVRTPEGEVPACQTCSRLYDLGSEVHFRKKWESRVEVGGRSFTPSEAFDAVWNDVSKFVVEVIAGHDPREAAKPKRLRDCAVIKFDGNAMGAFMSKALSFTDAIERSFRVDMALKNAYLKALEALYEGVRRVAGDGAAEAEVARVFLGTLYMGGDDGVLIAPAWAAPLLAHFIAEEFSRQLGLVATLTASVAAGPARMSVWSLVDCASAEMEEAKLAATRHRCGALVFDVFDSGSPSGATARERLKRYSRKLGEKSRDQLIDGYQPYLIERKALSGEGVPEAWARLFSHVLGVPARGAWCEDSSFKAHAEAFGKAYLASRAEGEDEEVERARKRLAALRRVALDTWREVSGSAYWREQAYIYVLRQLESEALGEETSEAYGALKRFIESNLFDESGNASGYVPLVDLLTFIKLVKGGAW
ncbi:HD domain-containing protein [Thermofilum pendens]|uniref:Metal dependent phosphohydrolase n=1 Tax=Thermofilum pendens (strain DSM 2475 / Hrk 5) TaxID=368408 RepID=A1RZQ8_THEPD|nr:HD domain-containing protein [Thermofilum pendens]ABL78688.1 metal dependent phosphohydrolase [Thermofilum pendens Hrk 5]